MAIKNVVQVPNPVLRQKSHPIVLGDDYYQLILDLKDTLNSVNLIGLAAPQLGVNHRVFVTNLKATPTRPGIFDQLRVFVNPEIVELDTLTCNIWEGCGSVNEGKLFSLITRSQRLTIRASDEFGQRFELTTNGLLARVILHEFEHLEGGLFTDHPSQNPEKAPVAIEIYQEKYKDSASDNQICQITSLEYKILS